MGAPPRASAHLPIAVSEPRTSLRCVRSTAASIPELQAQVDRFVAQLRTRSAQPGQGLRHAAGRLRGQGQGRRRYSTPDGELYLDYQGMFVMRGTFPGEYRSDFSGSFTITGGTNDFEGASEHAHMAVVDQPSGATNELVGSLKVG